jgi:hypothetical protein
MADIETLNASVASLQAEQVALGGAVAGIVSALDADLSLINDLRAQVAAAIASPANTDTAALAAASSALDTVTTNLAGYSSALTAAVAPAPVEPVAAAEPAPAV